MTKCPLNLAQLEQIYSELENHSVLPDVREVYGQLDRFYFNDAVQDVYRAESAAAVRSGFKTPMEAAGAKEALRTVGLHLPDYNRILRRGTRFFDELTTSPDKLTVDQAKNREEFLNKEMHEILAVCDARHKWIDAHPKEDPNQWLLPNFGESREALSDRVGLFMLGLMTPSMPDLVHNMLQTRVWNQAAEAACALALYHHKIGQYPDSIAVLTPTYLRETPRSTPLFSVTYERPGSGYKLSWISARTKSDGKHYSGDDVVVECPGK